MNMEIPIEDILSELVIRVQEHFKFDMMKALEAVAQSKLANHLCQFGNPDHLTLDQLSQQLYADISVGE